MKKIAVIGTGIMGAGIVSNFLKNGYEVFVWNRNPKRLKPLISKGAVAGSTPKEATEKADMVFEVTANDESSRLVWTGKEGILEGATTNKVLIACPTLSPSWTDKLAKTCKGRGFTFFDMPMTGGRVGAETGNLILLVGGDKEELEKIKKDLKAIAGKVFYFGKAGSGMRYKLILNMLQAIHLVGLGEALHLAERAGLELNKVGEALMERPGGAVTTLGWNSYVKEPSPISFSVKWITKDLGYAKELASTLEAPLLDDVLKKFRKAMKKNMEDRDWSSINKLKG